MNCKICKSEAVLFSKAKIMNKYDISYHICNNCNFVQTEDPFWLKEAYENPINTTDTGLVERNIYHSKIVSTIIYVLFNQNSKFIDYAGGYGLFTRLMRDIGFEYYWDDPYTTNLLAKGYDYDKKTKNFELLTCLEAFEHIYDPIQEVNNMTELSSNIFFSTYLLPKNKPKPNDWWYYGLNHGQHVSIYSFKSLQFLAKILNLNLYSDGVSLHLLTKKNINPLFFTFLIKFAPFGICQTIKTLMKYKKPINNQIT